MLSGVVFMDHKASVAQRELEQTRAKLLDMTLRNALLNFRASKRHSIEIVDEIAGEIFDLLVIQQQTMQFKPDDRDKASANLLAQSRRDDESMLAPRHIDRFLQTKLAREELISSMTLISRQAHSVFEEQGHSVLYIALGFLVWQDSSSTQRLCKAPLVLVPVELERAKTRSQFKIMWSKEDLLPNITLEKKLAEQGIDLPNPKFDSKDSINTFYRNMKTAIKNKKDWQVLSDIYLSFFSFTKSVMYEDLNPAKCDFDSLPLLAMLLQKEQTHSTNNNSVEYDLNAIDRKPSKSYHHIVDADSSQIAVIETIKAGKSLVVNGPPGTGKSQTITNIIAELLAQDKSILFVSAKMAALEVVKRRLDAVGLGDFCLELHSHKANKQDMLNELKRTLTSTAISGDDESNLFARIDGYKERLNEYVNALHEHVGSTGQSFYQLIGVRETSQRYFERVKRKRKRITFVRDLKEGNKNSYDQARDALHDLQDRLAKVIPITRHPWRDCSPVHITPLIEEKVNELVTRSKNWLEDLLHCCNELHHKCGVNFPQTLAELPHLLFKTDQITKSLGINEKAPKNVSNNDRQDKIEKIHKKIASLQKKITVAKDKFTPEAMACYDVTQLRDNCDDYQRLSIRWWRAFSPKFRCMHKNIRKKLYRSKAPQEPVQIIKDLQQLINYIADKNSLQHELISCKDDLNSGLNRLLELLKTSTDRLFASPKLEHVNLETLRARLNEWLGEQGQLRDWSLYCQAHDECSQTIAEPLLKHLEEIDPHDLVKTFEINFAEIVLEEALVSRQALKKFDREQHEKLIKAFCHDDRQCFEVNMRRLVHSLRQKYPDLTAGASLDSELAILKREFERKRGHLPVRKLLTKLGDLIKTIKPCFMMSPHSVAQFCDASKIEFDVVIFDEASQIRPEEALGSAKRGKQIVVVGDTQQLPPTRFFEKIVDEEEDEENYEDLLKDMPSILNYCQTFLPSRTLRWHYRSEHESLIAVSNQEFYDNKLYVFPSAIKKAEHLGLQFRHLPAAVYDRGKSATNRDEARAVVQAVCKHCKEYPDKSLGVGTFSSKQQQAIQDEIETQRANYPEMAEFVDRNGRDKFFVKNLETIQGDERDVIFISIGYGKDSNGKLHHNFGPLNGEGGYRRLNVLITRARERCVVFSNFTADDLQLSSNTPRGVKSLKKFLNYATTRDLDVAGPTGGDTDSPFEDAVYELLRGRGYEVSKQVGCAGYRIDLAVHDPKLPGRYLIGIECDGAQYHSSPGARDRDRLRQQILEKKGWKIHRVWSTEWYYQRPEATAQLLQAVEDSRS